MSKLTIQGEKEQKENRYLPFDKHFEPSGERVTTSHHLYMCCLVVPAVHLDGEQEVASRWTDKGGGCMKTMAD